MDLAEHVVDAEVGRMNSHGDAGPGLSAAEHESLRPYRKAIESAETSLKANGRSSPATTRGKTSQLERAIALRAAVDAARGNFRARLNLVETERLALLPANAVTVSNAGRAEDDHSEDRYKVVCSTPAGEQLDLGGCATLVDAQARAQWFERVLLERSGSATEPLAP